MCVRMFAACVYCMCVRDDHTRTTEIVFAFSSEHSQTKTQSLVQLSLLKKQQLICDQSVTARAHSTELKHSAHAYTHSLRMCEGACSWFTPTALTGVTVCSH
mmetsp:Transcript_7131/g.12284  ORF Transcript_7131/g.12284 Transcript_7131/m.12284 type:complete len:102 (+) Transcript_7131:717-1022(+)